MNGFDLFQHVRDLQLKLLPSWLAFASVVSPGLNVFVVLLQDGP